MNKSSNIVRWVIFGVLVIITVALTIWYYLGLSNIPKIVPPETMADRISSRTSIFLDWGYIKIGFGVLIAFISAIVAIVVAILRGVPMNKVISICVVVAALVILFITSNVISKDWIETELNFFYLTFGFSILAILFSVIYQAVKK